MSILLRKLKIKLWAKIVSFSRSKFYYPFLYRSYWVSLLVGNNKENKDVFFSSQPNIGAGIGHQMANWITGFWFAKQFNVEFAHLPFSNIEWEKFLGFGDKEEKVSALLSCGYKKVRLPLFDESNLAEVEMVKKIISSYRNKIVFVCEQDQFYRNQYGVIEELKKKFYNAQSRKNQELVFESNYLNIAIHIRRGDILADPNNPNLAMRYINDEYFENVLNNVLRELIVDEQYKIYVFSQGKPSDFESFNKFENLNLCLDMGAMDSFLHMVYADILITSKSSFSYKPALLNKGIKVCPDNFWHGYPKSNNWLLADNKGNFKIESQVKVI